MLARAHKSAQERTKADKSVAKFLDITSCVLPKPRTFDSIVARFGPLSR